MSSSPIRPVWLATGVAVLILAGCSGRPDNLSGGDTPEAPRAGAPATTPADQSGGGIGPVSPPSLDPCGLLPAPEAGKLARLLAPVAVSRNTTAIDRSCTFTAGDNDSASLSVSATSRATFAELRRATETAQSCTDLPGLGDAAYTCDKTGGIVAVYTRGIALIVHVRHIEGDDAKEHDAAIALATAATARIP